MSPSRYAEKIPKSEDSNSREISNRGFVTLVDMEVECLRERDLKFRTQIVLLAMYSVGGRFIEVRICARAVQTRLFV